MAHKNIDDRRAWLKDRMLQSHQLTVLLVEEAALLFGCSQTAIRNDWQFLNLLARRPCNPRLSKQPQIVSYGQTTLTQALKDIVTRRDGNICQYCEENAGDKPVFEHIVPAAWGGVSEPKNIVIACRSCNALKGRGVWIPHNFFEITARDPSWRRLAIHLQRKGKEQNGRRKTNQKNGAEKTACIA